MDDKLTTYLESMLPTDSEWVKELECQAKEERVPIMDRVSMNFVMQLIRLTKPKRILEIGTAIGYSALRMLEAYPEVEIITIERDEERYREAIKNIQVQNSNRQIKVIQGDALEEIPKLPKDKPFDLIFIDAAKGQYKRFFEASVPLLNNQGVILSDNVLFRGYVAHVTPTPPKYERLVEKIDNYNEWLVKQSDFSTSIIPIGDGLAISYKQRDERGFS